MELEKLGVRGISKSFEEPGTTRRVQVLDQVGFTVQEGEIVAIIGASGCGKTTLLRIIHGLIPNDGGAILVNGTQVQGPGFDRAMVFQHAGLLPWRTALTNVEFGLEIKGVPPQERRESALQYLKLVGLQGAEHKHPHQLSGGMQQRVGLARALAMEPELLLMDEPFGALDAQTKEVLQTELLRIHRQMKRTVVFVTHDLDEAVYLADRILVMAARPGRVSEIIQVPIPRPRPTPNELKVKPEFFEVRAAVGLALQNCMKVSGKQQAS